jgi:hypothetical protein
MMDGRLKYTKFPTGRLELQCSACNEPPRSLTEEADMGETWRLLVYPTCSATLGRWPSIVARENDLAALRATR